jgi:hypothetical protein
VLERSLGETVTTVVDRFLEPNYVHDGGAQRLDRAASAATVAASRDQIMHGEVDILEESVDGGSYTERHVYRAWLSDGTVLTHEVSVVEGFDPDGRFAWIRESSVPTTGPGS